MSNMNDAPLSKIERYRVFKEKHYVSTTYMFQIRKCSDDECLTCLPVRLPAEVFEKIHILPAPILDTSKEHYQKFTSVYGSTPTEKDKPSLKFSLEASTEDKENKCFSSPKRLDGCKVLYLS